MKRYLTPLMALLFVLSSRSVVAQQPANSPVAEKKPSVDHDKDEGKDKEESNGDKKIAKPLAAGNLKPQQNALPPSAATQSTKPVGVAVEPDYIIGPQDVLDIDVWQEKEFSRVSPVRPDGKISLPLLNDVQAAGYTPLQLSAIITNLLKKYVTDPQVTIEVAQINSRMIFLSGEITRPGAIPLLRNMTVLQAISMAGGPNQFANPKKIVIVRTENGKQVRYPFNYKDAIRGKATDQNIVLKPGDTIMVP
jgi:polysaccharide export outer membrane protein